MLRRISRIVSLLFLTTILLTACQPLQTPSATEAEEPEAATASSDADAKIQSAMAAALPVIAETQPSLTGRLSRAANRRCCAKAATTGSACRTTSARRATIPCAWIRPGRSG